MTKINQEEYEILKEALEEGYEYIARDADTILEKYKEKPFKFIKGDVWRNEDNFYGETHEYLGKDKFQFIQWEDDEPYSIQELIKEYEYSTEHVSHVVNERVKALDKAWRESEETEVKDLDWVKKRIHAERKSLAKSFAERKESPDESAFNDGKDSALDSVLRLLDKLPEQKILSPEWIEENREPMYFNDTMGYYVHHKRLEGLLVLKQEEVDQAYKAGYETGKDHATRSENPVIPKYVADWIEGYTQFADLYPALRTLENDRNSEVYEWYRKNTTDFVMAYLTREYEVVKEIKTYRFTQNAFMEQDFDAVSYEEAEKMAQDEWNRMFKKEGLFGEPEFEGWVE